MSSAMTSNTGASSTKGGFAPRFEQRLGDGEFFSRHGIYPPGLEIARGGRGARQSADLFHRFFRHGPVGEAPAALADEIQLVTQRSTVSSYKSYPLLQNKLYIPIAKRGLRECEVFPKKCGKNRENPVIPDQIGKFPARVGTGKECGAARLSRAARLPRQKPQRSVLRLCERRFRLVGDVVGGESEFFEQLRRGAGGAEALHRHDLTLVARVLIPAVRRARFHAHARPDGGGQGRFPCIRPSASRILRGRAWTPRAP